jgi:hypothetical protein
VSQHVCNATHDDLTVTVTLGYDRPLCYVFMTVSDGDDENPIYSNLNDPDAGVECQDVDYFRRVLHALGIVVPECLFTETVRDQVGNVGNREVVHEAVNCACAR